MEHCDLALLQFIARYSQPTVSWYNLRHAEVAPYRSPVEALRALTAAGMLIGDAQTPDRYRLSQQGQAYIDAVAATEASLLSRGFAIHPMTASAAREILTWRYAPPYTAYNGDGSLTPEAMVQEFLNPISPYFAVYASPSSQAGDDLIGFYAYGQHCEVTGITYPQLLRDDGYLTIGLGLRPDMTGRGLGLAFVTGNIDLALARYQPMGLRLFVYTFNQRAITTYQRARFTAVGMITTDHGEFLEMQRDATPSKSRAN